MSYHLQAGPVQYTDAGVPLFPLALAEAPTEALSPTGQPGNGLRNALLGIVAVAVLIFVWKKIQQQAADENKLASYDAETLRRLRDRLRDGSGLSADEARLMSRRLDEILSRTA